MTQPMTKDMAQQWMARWRAVDEREAQDLRKQSFDEKLRALAFLMASVDLFDMSSLSAEDTAARERWARLQSLMK
ncbi:MAG: hypothetical protein JO093_04050 [Acidobacteria bacterium]|nr:hypothetical protein [Acidobacteriota bacterium]MBV9070361.1 hypothetical protein [Acidobacteriota bacterium]MBV9184764.1 hypothetical protein [Acidobacteriota bacterium]